MAPVTSRSGLAWTWLPTATPTAAYRAATRSRYAVASASVARCGSPCTVAGASCSSTCSNVTLAPSPVATATDGATAASASRDPSSGTRIDRIGTSSLSLMFAAFELPVASCQLPVVSTNRSTGNWQLATPSAEERLVQQEEVEPDDQGRHDRGDRGRDP